MSQNLCFTEKSVFLCEHLALQQFAQNYLQNYNSCSVVCERKEDILAIKNQLTYEIEKLQQNKQGHLNNINFYSLDTLAKKMCLGLNAILSKEIQQQIPNSLLKPYLDVLFQEKLVELTLNLFGYNGTDSLALAKQILTLIDVKLPPDTNFVELILETQEGQNSKSTQHTTDISVRQILATLQQSQIELSNYARFQVLVKEYLNGPFLGILLNKKYQEFNLLPYELTSSPILWIGGIEYGEQNYTIKPGNYQKYLVDDFKNAINTIREVYHNKNNIFYESRTRLSPKVTGVSSVCNVYLSAHEEQFFQATQELISHADSHNFTVLADFDPHSFQAVHPDGHGDYAITKKDLENWQKQESTSDMYLECVNTQITEKYKQFLENLSRICSATSRSKIAEIYSLHVVNPDEKNSLDLFMSYALREKITIGDVHPLSLAPKVLSFFSTTQHPKKITCIGRPHNQISQSFNVKILNQVFFLLKQKGVDIEIPAGEAMYRLYWQNLVQETKLLDFWLTKYNEIEQFPGFIKVSNVLNLNYQSLPKAKFSFQNQQNTLIPNWQELFAWKNSNISITQFEDYVLCPHKFFLKYLLKIKKRDLPNTLNFKEIGTLMHKIGEQFITRMVTLFGNKDYIVYMPDLLETIVNTLKNEKLFLSFEKEFWIKNIKDQCVQKFKTQTWLPTVLNSLEESIHLIWGNQNNNSFLFLQQIEVLKRTFFKFLMTEQKNLSTHSKLKVGLFREFPIQFNYGNLKFSGRIDRIDLTKDGLEIIDYKTSNIKKSQKELVFSPVVAKKNSNSSLSVQGALYCYGFAKGLAPDEMGDDVLLYKIKYYSLYYLKNLDDSKNNCVQYEFEPAFEKQNANYMTIENEFAGYTQNLTEGNFSADPIQGDATCLFCDYKNVCPRTYGGC